MPTDDSHKVKDSNAALDFQFIWGHSPRIAADWLGNSETISSFVITASPGITVDNSTNDGYVVTVWLSGGTANQPYTVACRITTNQSRTDERTMTIRVIDR